MLSRCTRITTRAVSASSAVPVTRASTGLPDGLPARTQPISTSAAAAALSAASVVVACAPARVNWAASPGPTRHESPSHGAQPSTQNAATSSNWAATPGCPLVISAPTDSMSLADTASRASSGRDAAPAGRRRQGEHGAQHEQVGQRMDQLGGERARVVTRAHVSRAEHRDPADDEQGGRHDVAVRAARDRGADPGPVALGQRVTRRLAPRPEAGQPGDQGGQRQQPGQVGER